MPLVLGRGADSGAGEDAACAGREGLPRRRFVPPAGDQLDVPAGSAGGRHARRSLLHRVTALAGGDAAAEPRLADRRARLGDRAADVALDLFRDLLRTRANTPRYRIEHNTLLRDDQLRRYGQVGVVATIFGAFGTCAFNQGGFGRADLIPSAKRYLWWWRDLIAANPRFHVAWSSDWPVFSTNPFDHFYGFVSRRQIDAGGSVCKPEREQANDTLSRARTLRI